MTTYGYIRTSTSDQNAGLQQRAMLKYDITKVFADEGVSGTLAERPELRRLLDRLEPGDEVVVWKLDRLGRSSRNVLALIDEFTERGVNFRSLTEGLTTSGPMGKAMITVMAAFAQLERDTIVERTKAGLEAAKAKGRVGGRKTVVDEKKLDKIKKLTASGDYTRKEIADMVKISPATLYRVLADL